MRPGSATSGVNDEQSGRNPRSAVVLICAGIGMLSPYVLSPYLSLELGRRLGSHVVKSGQVTEKMLEEFYVCCQNLHD
jgi:hypothetical protein